MSLDNSTLTVKSGFSIGGRPASETESGEDATATIDLKNGSKVVVNNHNGMGLGYEAIGIMNIDESSAFECTQDFLITAKGTMNVNGTVNVTGTLNVAGTLISHGDIYGKLVKVADDAVIKIYAGKYSYDPKDYVVDGLQVVYDDLTELYTVVGTMFTLAFDTNGGNTIGPLRDVQGGTVVDLSSYTPTRSGYDFEGWFSDEALTNKVTSIKMDSDKTVYAKWDKVNTGGGTTVTKYTLSFDTNGGSNINSVSKARNATVNLSEYITTKSGYSFVGWYSDKELTKRVTEITLNRDMTVYAKWVVSEDKPIVEKPDYKPSILTDEHYAYIVGREGGMIAPESDITRAEVATIIYRLLDENERNKVKTKENVFTDVNESDWFNTAVSTLASLELVKGRTTDTFAPNNFITRAELATIFARMVEVEYDGKVLFSDVSGHWAESYINEAATAEWIVGYNGLFRPDDNITRAEVMTLVNRVLNREPESKADLLDGMITWKDNANENAWYYLAVQEATNSHTCEIKADGKHEKWTALTENPDWSKLEK